LSLGGAGFATSTCGFGPLLSGRALGAPAWPRSGSAGTGGAGVDVSGLGWAGSGVSGVGFSSRCLPTFSGLGTSTVGFSGLGASTTGFPGLGWSPGCAVTAGAGTTGVCANVVAAPIAAMASVTATTPTMLFVLTRLLCQGSSCARDASVHPEKRIAR
jgi:hypothetical protein